MVYLLTRKLNTATSTSCGRLTAPSNTCRAGGATPHSKSLLSLPSLCQSIHLQYFPLLHNKRVVVCALVHLQATSVSLATVRLSGMCCLLSSVTCRRDVFTVQLAAREATGSAGSAGFVCPVTDLDPARGYPFVALPGCGHTLSERALRQVRYQLIYSIGQSPEPT